MNQVTISIFGSKVFYEILAETKYFSEFKIKFYSKLSDLTDKNLSTNGIIIFFLNEKNINEVNNLKNINFPKIIAESNSKSNKFNLKEFLDIERVNLPIKILDFYNRVKTVFSKYEFQKSSLIKLGEYTIDKNERKIKKSNIELKLTEKEINFLALFTIHNGPLNKEFFLEHVWNYSSKTDTHTVETHIHRLRKKILEKFKDKNFIKNDIKGYYI